MEAMNRNFADQNQNPALETKMETNKNNKPEAHGLNAHLSIQLWLNKKINISVDMTTNQNQAFGQNMHG